MHWAPTDELYHHGILGMKWGKRNGPPYPLGQSQKSKAERKHLSAEQKQKIKKTVLTEAVLLGSAAANTVVMRKMTNQSMDPKKVAKQIIAMYATASIGQKAKDAIKKSKYKKQIEIAGAGLAIAGTAIGAYQIHKFFSPSNISAGKAVADSFNLASMTMEDLKKLDLY